MVINLAVVGAALPQASLGTIGVDSPVVNKTDTTNSNNGSSAPVPAANNNVTPDANSATSVNKAEEKRYEAVLQASQNFFKDVYAVSDTSFTIYKDSSGQYITRYTSLRDGKVTYVPEQSIVQYGQSRAHGNTSLFEIQA